MSDQERCPKCGAAFEQILVGCEWWGCESCRSQATGEFEQSGHCQANELKREVERLRVEVEELSRGGVHWWHEMRKVAKVLGVEKLSNVCGAVEWLRALLHEVWVAADKGEIDGVDLGWMAGCDEFFASAASEPEQPTP